MDGYDHSKSGPPVADPDRSAESSRRSSEAAATGAAPGLRAMPVDDTAFHEANRYDGDGKSRRAAPWPFLVRRLG